MLEQQIILMGGEYSIFKTRASSQAYKHVAD